MLRSPSLATHKQCSRSLKCCQARYAGRLCLAAMALTQQLPVGREQGRPKLGHVRALTLTRHHTLMWHLMGKLASLLCYLSTGSISWGLCAGSSKGDQQGAAAAHTAAAGAAQCAAAAGRGQAGKGRQATCSRRRLRCSPAGLRLSVCCMPLCAPLARGVVSGLESCFLQRPFANATQGRQEYIQA